MIILLKNNPKHDELQSLIDWLRNMGLDVHISEGAEQTLLGLIGDTSHIDTDLIQALDIVESVKRIQEPYKNANRKFHPDDSVFEVGKDKDGNPQFSPKKKRQLSHPGGKEAHTFTTSQKANFLYYGYAGKIACVSFDTGNLLMEYEVGGGNVDYIECDQVGNSHIT